MHTYLREFLIHVGLSLPYYAEQFFVFLFVVVFHFWLLDWLNIFLANLFCTSLKVMHLSKPKINLSTLLSKYQTFWTH